MVQFALISLIPGLLRRLEDAADPDFDSYAKNLVMPASLKTSERSSCKFSIPWRFMLALAYLIIISVGLHGLAITAVGVFVWMLLDLCAE